MTDTVWGVVGVLEPEERVYEALILRGQATTADLVAELGFTRNRISRILSRLATQGLVTHLPGRPTRFAAVMPDIAASELIAAQESQLRRLREYAQQLATARRARSDARHHTEVIEVIEGADNVRRAFIRLQREAQSQIRVFDKPPYTAAQPDGNPEEYRLLREGRVRYRTVYDRAGLIQPERMTEIRNGIQHGERARVARSLPMKMALCDDDLALIPVSTAGASADQAAYVVHPSSLLDALSELFEAVWDKAVPLNRRPKPGHNGHALTDRDFDLLGLLAAGATDETIARTFGWSVRTVRRHVHRIMEQTGTETRFQAGMEASRRGWVLSARDYRGRAGVRAGL